MPARICSTAAACRWATPRPAEPRRRRCHPVPRPVAAAVAMTGRDPASPWVGIRRRRTAPRRRRARVMSCHQAGGVQGRVAGACLVQLTAHEEDLVDRNHHGLRRVPLPLTAGRWRPATYTAQGQMRPIGPRLRRAAEIANTPLETLLQRRQSAPSVIGSQTCPEHPRRARRREGTRAVQVKFERRLPGDDLIRDNLQLGNLLRPRVSEKPQRQVLVPSRRPPHHPRRPVRRQTPRRLLQRRAHIGRQAHGDEEAFCYRAPQAFRQACR